MKPRIRAGLDALRTHPTDGTAIKRLKGHLREYFRYRVGDYRLVYTVEQKSRVVYVDYIQHRKDVYR